MEQAQLPIDVFSTSQECDRGADRPGVRTGDWCRFGLWLAILLSSFQKLRFFLFFAFTGDIVVCILFVADKNAGLTSLARLGFRTTGIYGGGFDL